MTAGVMIQEYPDRECGIKIGLRRLAKCAAW
jgi:hypothetical protein